MAQTPQSFYLINYDYGDSYSRPFQNDSGTVLLCPDYQTAYHLVREDMLNNHFTTPPEVEVKEDKYENIAFLHAEGQPRRYSIVKCEVIS